MKAPMSDIVRKILSNPELSKKLMQAIQSERRNPSDLEGRTIVVDGKKVRLARLTMPSKKG